VNLSIRWRLAIWIGIALLLTLLALNLTVHFALRAVLSADLNGQLSKDLQQISAELNTAGSLQQADLARIVAPVSFIVVIRDPSANVLAATPGVKAEDLALQQTDLARLLQGSVLHGTSVIGGDRVRVWSSRLTIGPQVVGIMQVGENAEHLGKLVQILEMSLIGEGLAALLIAPAAGYWLARRALRPISAISKIAQQIEASDLDRRIGVHGNPEEAQQLADTFDGMLERLSEAFQQQRSFVHDVSHELRTPLTALMGNLDLLLMNDGIGEEMRSELERMSVEVKRLIRLTSNILYLAQGDTGLKVLLRPVALDTLCLEVYRQTRDLRPQVKLRLGRQDQLEVMGDLDLLKQVVVNLVDNGLKYTAAGGKVTLSLIRDDSCGLIVVEDTGPGIRAEEIPRIFDRYYRGAGSGGVGRSGAGIGLAISDWIARAHGGRIEVESEAGRGSTFTVRIPLSPLHTSQPMSRAGA
jgi:two-component system OmpR family sensor kinase